MQINDPLMLQALLAGQYPAGGLPMRMANEPEPQASSQMMMPGQLISALTQMGGMGGMGGIGGMTGGGGLFDLDSYKDEDGDWSKEKIGGTGIGGGIGAAIAGPAGAQTGASIGKLIGSLLGGIF